MNGLVILLRNRRLPHNIMSIDPFKREDLGIELVRHEFSELERVSNPKNIYDPDIDIVVVKVMNLIESNELVSF
jgi:hypothetical protein